MPPEHFPGRSPEIPAEVDYDALHSATGLGPAEFDQPLEYQKSDGTVIQGTVGQMLSDEACPVGQWVATAYEKGGLEGSYNKVNLAMQMADQPPVPISEQTKAYHEGKISRDELLGPKRTEVQEDFLGIQALRNRYRSQTD